jgi:CubicO group peptidase (beta-lactamase class C family)
LSAPIDGVCAARFAEVRALFADNFSSHDDVGASVAVTIDGELAVDLWGGYADAAKTSPWRRDTIAGVASTSKTATALCALLLADRGELDLDAPVARYWPEFAAAGKEGVRVGHVLGHCSGLPGWTEKLAFEDLYDWEKATSLLARQAPWWTPGEASAYHAVTQGYLVGEVVRRITGCSLGRFLAEEITGPLGVDFHIGLDPAHDHRLAETIPSPPGDLPPPPADSMFARIADNPRTPPIADLDERWLRAEIPAGNGVSNARSVALMQAALACEGEVGGRRLMSVRGCRAALAPRFRGLDLAFQIPIEWGAGFALSMGPHDFGPGTCFWGGSGGSLIVVDFERRMTFAYVMNRSVGAPFGDPRNARLVEATYAALRSA